MEVLSRGPRGSWIAGWRWGGMSDRIGENSGEYRSTRMVDQLCKVNIDSFGEKTGNTSQ